MRQQEKFLLSMENLRVTPYAVKTPGKDMVWKPSEMSSIHFINGKCVGLFLDADIVKVNRFDLKTIVSFALKNSSKIKP